MIKIAPSVLAADFLHLEKDVDTVNKYADILHFDVMDGSFVPNISFGQPVLKSVRKCTDLFLDVHLMIDEPIRYAEDFKKNGADMLTVHLEACSDVKATLNLIRECGMKSGLAIKPKTPASAVMPYLELCDMILVMTVEPGFGGQSFMADMMDKITEIRKAVEDKKLNCLIQVDGGINGETVKIAAKAGANVFVAGSYVFGAVDVTEKVASLVKGAEEAIG